MRRAYFLAVAVAVAVAVISVSGPGMYRRGDGRALRGADLVAANVFSPLSAP